MQTLTITNTSGTDIVAGDGTLPDSLSWVNLADSASIPVVVQIHDLSKVQENHSGFTMADILQQLKQSGKISCDLADIGDDEDDGSIYDHAVATAA